LFSHSLVSFAALFDQIVCNAQSLPPILLRAARMLSDPSANVRREAGRAWLPAYFFFLFFFFFLHADFILTCRLPALGRVLLSFLTVSERVLFSDSERVLMFPLLGMCF
jgi:hypothetical protein